MPWSSYVLTFRMDVQFDTNLSQEQATDLLTDDGSDKEHLLVLLATGINQLLEVADPHGMVKVNDLCSHLEGTRKPPSVVEYFEDRLGEPWPYPVNARNPDSPAHPDFHIETVCGRGCADAIDTAVEAIRHVRKGFGDDQPELIKGIFDACSAVVRVYVYG